MSDCGADIVFFEAVGSDTDERAGFGGIRDAEVTGYLQTFGSRTAAITAVGCKGEPGKFLRARELEPLWAPVVRYVGGVFRHTGFAGRRWGFTRGGRGAYPTT